MQSDFIDQYDWGDWLDQFFPNIPNIQPGYDPTADGFFGKSFLKLIDVLKVYLQDQDTDDINRIFRAREFTTLFSVLQDYDAGRATLEDVKAVDVGLLSDIDEFNEWYNALGNDTDDNGDTDDTTGDTDSGFTGNGYDLTAEEVKDAVEKLGQDVYDQATGALNSIVDETKAIVQDPVGALEQIARNIIEQNTGVTISEECGEYTRGGAEWFKKCVKFGVILSIPGLEIPAAILGSVFGGATIQDMEDVLVAAGKKWEDIKNGTTTPEQILEDLGDWVTGKITDVFKDIEGGITVEGILKKIGDFLPPVIAAVVYNKFKDKINTAIGVPVFLTTEEQCEAQGTTEDPNNPGSCLPVTEEPTFDCASVNRSGGVVNTEEDCGGCLDGYQASDNGCIESPVTCGENEKLNELTGKCEEVVDFTPGDPCNTDEGAGKYNQEGECIVDENTENVECTNGATKESGCEECADGSSPDQHEGNNCSGELITENPNSDDELCNGPRPPQTQNDKNYCFDQGYAPCGEGTEEYQNGRWYKECTPISGDPCASEPEAGSFAYYNCVNEGWGTCDDNTEKAGEWVFDPTNNCGATTSTECGNGATEESNCEKCEDGSLPSEHEGNNCGEDLLNNVTPPPEECPEGQQKDEQGNCVCPEGQQKDEQGNCVTIPVTPPPEIPPSEPPPPGSPCAQQNRVENEDGSCGPCLPGYMIDPQGFDQCVSTGIPVNPPPGGGKPEPTGGGGSIGGGTGMFKPSNVSLEYNRTPELVVSKKPFVDYSSQLNAQVARLLSQRNKDIV